MEMTRGRALKRFPTLTWRRRAKITPGTDGNALTEGVGGEHNDKSKAFFYSKLYGSFDLCVCLGRDLKHKYVPKDIFYVNLKVFNENKDQRRCKRCRWSCSNCRKCRPKIYRSRGFNLFKSGARRRASWAGPGFYYGKWK